MPECLILSRADSRRLIAEEEPLRERQVWPCPISFDHNAGSCFVGEIALELKHSKRDQAIISSSWTSARVVHESLLAEFDKRGFSGYQLRPATVRFRDGSLSTEYRQLIVVGWGGHARPESGIRVREECPECHRREYTPLEDAEQLIDWSQWTGDDFFMVWPLPNYTMITKRVADALASLDVKGYTLENLESLDARHSSGFGYVVPRLSFCLPEDLAIKYGRPLGLD